jgi:hypothetical protein
MVLTSLINDLAALDTPFILALDDYHVIHTPAIHQQHAPGSLVRGMHLEHFCRCTSDRSTKGSEKPFSPLHYVTQSCYYSDNSA